MSYILDALKKADAEREREGVPGLHAQHSKQVMSFDASETSGGIPAGARWAAGGVAAGLALLAAWWWLPRPEPVVSATVQATPEPTWPQAATMAPRPMPTPPVNVPPTPAVRPEAHAPSNMNAQNGAGVDSPIAKSPAHSTNTPSRVTPSAPVAPERIVPVAELPEDVRRELPALSIGGAMHSDIPANRMLVLNGGIFHEGDQPAPGLLLEEIKLKSAIFRFKGQRYSVAF
jgi:general secretion pathway protein B